MCDLYTIFIIFRVGLAQYVVYLRTLLIVRAIVLYAVYTHLITNTIATFGLSEYFYVHAQKTHATVKKLVLAVLTQICITMVQPSTHNVTDNNLTSELNYQLTSKNNCGL